MNNPSPSEHPGSIYQESNLDLFFARFESNPVAANIEVGKGWSWAEGNYFACVDPYQESKSAIRYQGYVAECAPIRDLHFSVSNECDETIVEGKTKINGGFSFEVPTSVKIFNLRLFHRAESMSAFDIEGESSEAQEKVGLPPGDQWNTDFVRKPEFALALNGSDGLAEENEIADLWRTLEMGTLRWEPDLPEPVAIMRGKIEIVYHRSSTKRALEFIFSGTQEFSRADVVLTMIHPRFKRSVFSATKSAISTSIVQEIEADSGNAFLGYQLKIDIRMQDQSATAFATL